MITSSICEDVTTTTGSPAPRNPRVIVVAQCRRDLPNSKIGHFAYWFAFLRYEAVGPTFHGILGTGESFGHAAMEQSTIVVAEIFASTDRFQRGVAESAEAACEVTACDCQESVFNGLFRSL